MEEVPRQLATFPILREHLVASVDTVALVQHLPELPPYKELWNRGFKPKEGNQPNSTTWFHNCENAEHRPNLTIYENHGPGFGLLVSGSLPRIRNANNATLLMSCEIAETMDEISGYVTDTVGLAFDAWNAKIKRVDYAFDQFLEPQVADGLLERTRRLYIPHIPLNSDMVYDSSVYRTNQSRGLRLYDKSIQMGWLNEQYRQLRSEYWLPNRNGVEAFRKRKGLADRRAITMLSREVITMASDEAFDLLQLGSFDPTADYSFAYFLEKTNGNYSKARRLSSFVDAFYYFGPDFYLRSDVRVSKQTYVKEFRECQALGF